MSGLLHVSSTILHTSDLQDLVARNVPHIPHGLSDDAYRAVFNGAPLEALAADDEQPLAVDTEALAVLDVPPALPGPGEEAPRQASRARRRLRQLPDGPAEAAPATPIGDPHEGDGAPATPIVVPHEEDELHPPQSMPVPPLLLPGAAAADEEDDEAYLNNILAKQSWGVFKFTSKRSSIEARCPYHRPQLSLSRWHVRRIVA